APSSKTPLSSRGYSFVILLYLVVSHYNGIPPIAQENADETPDIEHCSCGNAAGDRERGFADAGATKRTRPHSVERENHHGRRTLCNRAGPGDQRRPHSGCRHEFRYYAACRSRYTPDRSAWTICDPRLDRQPHAPAARRRHVAVGSTLGWSCIPQRSARSI